MDHPHLKAQARVPQALGLSRGAFALLLVALLCLPGFARATGACSAYKGQVLINEIRIGKSNAADAKNQVELLNVGNVAPAVWQTWSIQIWLKDGNKAAVKKGGYPLSAGHTASGDFIWNNTTKYWLQNKPAKYVDIALLDANGDFVAYFAINGQAQTVPGCMAPLTTAPGSGGGGGIMRTTDGGNWPASLIKTNVHTIGRTNVCSAGADVVVSIDVDYLKAVQNSTTVTFVITAFNNACSAKASGVKLSVTNLSSGYFSSFTTATSAGSGNVTVSGNDLLWDAKDLNAGTARTLTVTGIPKNLGTLTSVATVTAPASGLINTGDDTDSTSMTVYAFNYVGFSLATDSATEGQDTNLAATIETYVPATAAITVNYSVGGTAGAGDTNLGVSGSIVIPAGETSGDIEFTITNDTVHEATKTIVLTITSVTSGDAKVKIGTLPNGDILTETITLYDDDPPTVDHYELSLPSTGVSCLASNVTVTACADASSPCTNAATSENGKTAALATSAGALGAATVTFNASGVATTTLSHAAAANGAVATVTLSAEQTTATNPRKCCPNGVACAAGNSCAMTFSTSGFIVSASAGGVAATLPTLTAGTASAAYWLRAVKTGTTTKSCEAALSGAQTVNWAYQCNNPTTCSPGNRMTLTGSAATVIAANPNTGVTASTAVPMVFDANGNAPFSFAYADVGQVTLSASKAAGGALLSALAGSSNAFVVKPAGFVLSAIKCTNYVAGGCATAAIANPGNNPGAANAAGTAFIPAGQPFSATVTAVDSGGNATPNYGRETPAEGVTLSAALVQPAGGSAPALSNAAAFGAFASGAATGTTFAWSEAGIISLTPSVGDGSYLGVGNVTGTTSGNVGRFTAHRFTVAVAPGCSASFTYGGQAMTATVTALNSAGSTLVNYGGTSFAKAVTLSDAGALGVGSFSGGNAIAAAAFTAGVGAGSPVYGFTSKLTAPQTLALRATDSDGASSAGYIEGSSLLRSGRLRLANAFGRENAALQLTALAEYWTGADWLLNGSDSCTTVPATAMALSNQRSGNGSVTAAWSTTPGAIAITAGTGLLTLSAPSPAGTGSTGSVDIGINLGAGASDQSCLSAHPASTGAARAWLRSRNGACAATYDRDPSARATFGIYSPESRKTVHARELF